jgi:hypothetical protein
MANVQFRSLLPIAHLTIQRACLAWIICCPLWNASAFAQTSGKWAVDPKTQWSDEVRVWNSDPQHDLEFSWSGEVNTAKEADGPGTLTWSDPHAGWVSTFVGEMKNGKRSGQGKWFHKSGAKYEGEWRDNLKDGYGRYFFPNGDYYEGNFRADKMAGTGRYGSTDGLIYEGGFDEDERHGLGALIFPDRHRYESTWDYGRDTRAVTTLAANEAAQRGSTVSVSADTSKYSSGPKGVVEDIEQDLLYRSTVQEGVVRFEPDWPFWSHWSKGGPINFSDEFGFDNGGVHPAYLQVRIFNDEKEKLSIAKAEVFVEESHPDLEPILQLTDSTLTGGVSAHFENFGWGTARDCEIRFKIIAPAGKPVFDSYRFTARLGSIEHKADFDLGPALKELGLDTGFLKASGKRNEEATGKSSDESEAPAAPVYDQQNVTRALAEFAKTADRAYDGKIKTAYALIVGEIAFTWRDHLQNEQHKTVRFTLSKCLYFFSPETGGPANSSGTYKILLRTAGENYYKPIDYKGVIKPGANDRFEISVAALQSSFHTFRIRLETTGGRELLSPPCSLHLLVPSGGFVWPKKRN